MLPLAASVQKLNIVSAEFAHIFLLLSLSHDRGFSDRIIPAGFRLGKPHSAAGFHDI
jgi:hypothetical protein